MKYLTFLSIIGLICTTALFSETTLYGIKLSAEQDAELQTLTHLYKWQISHHFDLCTSGKHPHYKRQDPGEFDHLFKKSEKELLETIQNLTTLYAKIGVPQEIIAQEEKSLREGVQSCMA